MKVAVILTGHPRSFELVCNSFKQRFDVGITVDFFCHVWSDSNGTHLSWTNRGQIKPSRSKVGKVVSCINPKVLVYKVQNAIAKDVCGNSLVLSNLRSMFSGVCDGIKLVLQYSEETGEEYDLIIRGRYDLVLGKELSVSELRKSIDERCMFVAGSDTYHQLGGVSDVFFFAPPVAMRKLLGIGRFIEITQKKQADLGEIVIPEILFRNYLDQENISIDFTELPCSIMRSSGQLLMINQELLSGKVWNSILLFNSMQPSCSLSKSYLNQIMQEGERNLQINGVQDSNLIVSLIYSSVNLAERSRQSFDPFEILFDHAEVFYRAKGILGRDRMLSWLVRRVWLNAFQINKIRGAALLFSNKFLFLLLFEYIVGVFKRRLIYLWRRVFGL
jgi:hypothetical protein